MSLQVSQYWNPNTKTYETFGQRLHTAIIEQEKLQAVEAANTVEACTPLPEDETRFRSLTRALDELLNWAESVEDNQGVAVLFASDVRTVMEQFS